MENKKKMTTYQMTTTACFTAVMCVLGPMSIPIGQVPITFTNLVIYLAVFLLGTKFGTLSYGIYFLLGFVGLPVFSGYSGGPGKILGPTGGYLVGFFLMAIVCGICVEKFAKNYIMIFIGMIVGTALAYLFGTVWFVLLTGKGLVAALSACVVPFLPGDAVKIISAAILVPELKKAINLSRKLA